MIAALEGGQAVRVTLFGRTIDVQLDDFDEVLWLATWVDASGNSLDELQRTLSRSHRSGPK